MTFSNRISLEEILPDEFYGDLKITKLFSIYVPITHASEIQSILSGDDFTKKYPHLKRLRKTSSSEDSEIIKESNRSYIEVLLGDKPDLPYKLHCYLDENNIAKSVSTATVPISPPLTKLQYYHWCKVWPVVFRQPSRKPHILTSDEINRAIKYIALARHLGTESKKLGSLDRGCVIVLNDIVIGYGFDKRYVSYPWDHPAIDAIRNTSDKLKASRDVRYMGNKSPGNNPSSVNSILTNSYGVLLNQQYLCTSATAYLSHEPCVSCSMALLHSRISQVFYEYTNNESGGLGSRCKLHCLTSLNHHFTVFKVSLPS